MDKDSEEEHDSKRSSLKSSILEEYPSRCESPDPCFTEDPLSALESIGKKKPAVTVTKATKNVKEVTNNEESDDKMQNKSRK